MQATYMPTDVAAYLSTLPGVSKVNPAVLIVPRVTSRGIVTSTTERIVGAFYADANHADTIAFYGIGDTPTAFKRKRREYDGTWSQRFVYRLPNDSRDWYVACHSPAVIAPEYRKQHPLGRFFILKPYDIPATYPDGRPNPFHGKAIDAYSQFTCERLTCVVE